MTQAPFASTPSSFAATPAPPAHFPWPLLWRLWRAYLRAPGLPMLDRWLKQQQRQGGELAALAPAQLLQLGAVLREGVNFLQLACALEQAYSQGEPEDWQHWDRQWQPAQAPEAYAFWLWVCLRLNWPVADMPARDPAQRQVAADIAPRREFVQRWAQLMTNETALQPRALLWAGLRPAWAALLAERAQASGWQAPQLQQFLAAQTCLPPLWLRPQQGQSPAALCQRMSREGVNTHLSEQGYVYAQGGRGVASTSAYREGLVEIQDLASQQIAAAINATKGQKVWDCCAGAGGKTLALAQGLANSGMVLATDLHAYKLEELKRRAKRAQVFNVRSFTWDGEAPLRLPAEAARQQGFDWVLLDAPCTAAGTWRRNPDARWRFSPQDSHELVQLQARLLALAAQAVRPGGNLVYATCSWQLAENEAQLAPLLAQGWQLQLSQLLGAPELDADTMYVARLQKP